MQKKISIYTIAAFILVLAMHFTSCEEDELVYELELDTSILKLGIGDVATVVIKTGNEGYTVNAEPANIVTASIAENEITVTAVAAGQTVLTVTDRAGKTGTVSIQVKGDGTLSGPSFSWDQSFQLEDVNNWGLTVFTGRIAVTNIPQKAQYVLTWDGNLSEGAKEDGVLMVYKDEKLASTVSLTTFTVFNDEDGYYTIVFGSAGQTGQIVFSK